MGGRILARSLAVPRGHSQILLRFGGLGRLRVSCDARAHARTSFQAGPAQSVQLTVRAGRGGAVTARRDPGGRFSTPRARGPAQLQTWTLHGWSPTPGPLTTITVAFGFGPPGSHDCGVTAQGLLATVPSG